MRTRVKICGNRSEADIHASVAGGADAVGLICGVTHVSEDKIEPDEAQHLASLVPPYVSVVLVTHLQESGEILELARHIGAETIQLHGEIEPLCTEEVRRGSPPGRRITQAVHVVDEGAIARAEQFAEFCDAILLDSRTEDRLGGTGRTHDWDVSRRVVERMNERNVPTILAGGLEAGNVREAIETVGPFAVDVNSGVDGLGGNKDAERIAAFMSAVTPRTGVPQAV